MTVAELLAEICSRCGEGYENYTERARQAFESGVSGLLYGSRISEIEAPGLCRVGVYNPTLPATKIPLATLIAGAGLTEGKLRSLRYSTDVKAQLTTDLAGSDNNITFTALEAGTSGNLIAVEYVDPGVKNMPLAITVSQEGTCTYITVSLATNDSLAIDTDAQTLAETIAAFESVYYITAAIKNGETGAGILTAMDKAYLTGGAGDGTMTDLERITHAQYLASIMLPSILDSVNSVSFYMLSGTGTDAQIELLGGATIGAGSNLEYSIIGWNDTWFDTTSTVLTDLFTPQYLEMLIQSAVTTLRGEILA